MYPEISRALLKVANKDGVGDTVVLLVHRPASAKLSRRSRLLCKNCSSDGRNLFFAVVGVEQESRTPRVTTDRSSCNEDSRCGQLAGKVMVQVVALKCPVQDVARELNNRLIGMSSLEEANKESMSTRNSDLIFQRLQDILLHLENLLYKERRDERSVRDKSKRQSVMQ